MYLVIPADTRGDDMPSYLIEFNTEEEPAIWLEGPTGTAAEVTNPDLQLPPDAWCIQVWRLPDKPGEERKLFIGPRIFTRFGPLALARSAQPAP